jgi:hypothetical protein
MNKALAFIWTLDAGIFLGDVLNRAITAKLDHFFVTSLFLGILSVFLSIAAFRFLRES